MYVTVRAAATQDCPYVKTSAGEKLSPNLLRASVLRAFKHSLQPSD
jgi:hypothetical protein